MYLMSKIDHTNRFGRGNWALIRCAVPPELPKFDDPVEINIMTEKFNFFDEVNDKSNSWKVRARISRMWEAVNLQDKTQSYGLHMLLLDEKSNQIHHAKISPGIQHKFEKKLIEGDIFVIDKFEVKETTGRYRPVRSKYTISLTKDTIVSPSKEIGTTFIKYNFSFVEFEDLMKTKDISVFHTKVNFIGKLIRVGPKKPQGFREIIIQNERGSELTIALWGDNSDRLSNISNQEEDMMLCIITSLYLKMIGKEYKLCLTSATKLYLNLEHFGHVD
ncbi:hypothetical protein IFM89_035535 [Coptis chinensis]|uniref:Replication protein A 70 kDa DNA-binding subunit B/D first OB fold domain-containing protein n=1 Tax=Coptis chinensis TaxID=261450 RepID=A0A835H7C4_9MAGN|nr:hypothetical protein IFM89_035535 [Coptis chinensis]